MASTTTEDFNTSPNRAVKRWNDPHLESRKENRRRLKKVRVFAGQNLTASKGINELQGNFFQAEAAKIKAEIAVEAGESLL